MRRTLHAAGALAAGVTLALAATTPAMAHVADAYHGSRGHAWTNTAHTRVGVQDTNCDGLRVWAEVRTNLWATIGELPFTAQPDCGGGYQAWQLPADQVVWALRVCAATRGCGDWVWA